MTTQTQLDEVYAEVKRMRLKLKSLEKSLNNLAGLLLPEEKLTPQEIREIEVLKNEALKGNCVPYEEVLKKHGAKRSA